MIYSLYFMLGELYKHVNEKKTVVFIVSAC